MSTKPTKWHEIDALLGVARLTTDDSRREELLDRILELLDGEAPTESTVEGAKQFIVSVLNTSDHEMYPTSVLNALAKEEGFSDACLRRAKTELKRAGTISYASTGNRKGKRHYIYLEEV